MQMYGMYTYMYIMIFIILLYMYKAYILETGKIDLQK